MKAPKLYHVAFSAKSMCEGFITDDARDADWTATGRPQMNAVPTIGDQIREWLDSPKAKLPRRYALVFGSEEDAREAMAVLSARNSTPTKGD